MTTTSKLSLLTVLLFVACDTGGVGDIRDFLTTQGADYCPAEIGLVATIPCGIEVVPGIECRECITSEGQEAGCALNNEVWCETSCGACEQVAHQAMDRSVGMGI